MLTFTFRYFFGSLLISAISARRSVTAPFMFSYNCLSFSNCPAVPSPVVQLRHQLIEPFGDRVQPVEERRVGHQLAGRALRRDSAARSASSRFVVAAVSDCENVSSFSSLPRLPSPALMRRVSVLDVLERRLERVRGLRVVQQLAERAAPLLELVASVCPAVATNCCSSAYSCSSVISLPTVPLPARTSWTSPVSSSIPSLAWSVMSANAAGVRPGGT